MLKANVISLALILTLITTTQITFLSNHSAIKDIEALALEVNDKPMDTTSDNPAMLEPEPIPEAPIEEPATDPEQVNSPMLTNTYQSSPKVSSKYATPTGEVEDFKYDGVWSGDKYVYTWYSDKQPGLDGATAYPIEGGKHLDADGIYRDSDGYVCVAANKKTAGKYEVVDTPFGKGKVYDTGCNAGVIDIYTSF